MAPARSLSEYRSALQSLLDDATLHLTDAETAMLRAIVRQQRSGRRGQPPTPAPPNVLARAGEIVGLLGAAAKELRPRETQELDDLVAGRSAAGDAPPGAPIRLRRTGLRSR